jgi:hypothetical protein
MATNLELLESAGLIKATNLPNAGDVSTINSLNQADVQGLINVFSAVGGDFLIRNCGGSGSTVAPAPGVRSIGIVF